MFQWAGLALIRLVSGWRWFDSTLQLCFLFRSCGLWTLSCDFAPMTDETLKWFSSLPILMQEPVWWWQSSIIYSSLSTTSWYLGLHQCLSRDNSALNKSNNNQKQPKKDYIPFNQMPMKTPPEDTLFTRHAGNHYPVSYLFFRYFQKTLHTTVISPY